MTNADVPYVVDTGLNVVWYKNCQIHRDGDLPAVMTFWGSMEWWRDGVQHRENNRPASLRFGPHNRSFAEYWEHGVFLGSQPPPKTKSAAKR